MGKLLPAPPGFREIVQPVGGVCQGKEQLAAFVGGEFIQPLGGPGKNLGCLSSREFRHMLQLRQAQLETIAQLTLHFIQQGENEHRLALAPGRQSGKGNPRLRMLRLLVADRHQQLTRRLELPLGHQDVGTQERNLDGLRSCRGRLGEEGLDLVPFSLGGRHSQRLQDR